MLALALAAPTACVVAAAEIPFPLAQAGEPAATIVVSSSPTRAASFGAAELRYHVARMTGTLLPIVTEAKEVTGPQILVGESKATAALGLRSQDYADQERLVKFYPQCLVLIGRDAPPVAVGAGDDRSPRWTAGRFGKGLRFDGRNDYLVVDECGFDDDAGALEAWVWLPAEPQDAPGTILRLDGANPWTYHIIQRAPKSRRVGYWTYDGKRGHTVLSEELEPGWRHVLATHSAKTGTMRLYVDGKLQGETDYVRTTCAGAELRIGGLPSGGKVSNVFAGITDEVRVSKATRPPGDLTKPPDADVQTTLLLHCDEGMGMPQDSTGRTIWPPAPEWFEPRGTLDAVYDFLERFCDVRWYAPTEIGLVCPRQPTLIVRGDEFRHRPAMRYRWIAPRPLRMPTKDDIVPAGETRRWMLRMRLGGDRFEANHSFYGYYDRFLKDHPDWFARGYQGRPPQMCYTHPEFIRQVVQDARDFFDGKGLQPGAKGMGDYFALVPMDNHNWCRCEDCQSLMNREEADNQQFTNGRASDYIFGFVDKVAREVARSHPDKCIAALAYASYAKHPRHVAVAPNVAVMMCLTARHVWAPGMVQADREVFEGWTRSAQGKRPLYLWLYYNFPALNATHGKYEPFPGFFSHTVVQQMKRWTDAGIRGFFLEHSSEAKQSYLLDQLEFYLTFKLADDPSLDGEQLIDEFFRRYYGAAAAPMRQLYEAIEQTYCDPANYPPEARSLPGSTQHQNEEIAWRWLGTEKRMARFAELMEAAMAAAPTEVEHRRVELFRRGVWGPMQRGREEYLQRAVARRRPPPTITVPCIPPAEKAQDVDWVKTAQASPWSQVNGDPISDAPVARLGHDGRRLHVRFVDAARDGKLTSAGNIWSGDDFELFFARQRGRPYRQLGIAPDGRFVALAHGERQPTWDSGAVVVSESSAGQPWRVWVTLPLERLLPGGVRPGERIYANLCRATPSLKLLLAWSPTFTGSFHEPRRFGEMVLQGLR